MADWGLQAVIRPNEYDDHLQDHEDHHHHHHQHNHDQAFGSIDMKKEYDQALLFCYPHLFDHHHDYDPETTSTTAVVGGELDQLYKPFYPLYETNEIEFPPPPMPVVSADLQTIHHHHHHHQDSDQEVQHQEQHIRSFCESASKPSQIAPKLKKRKNQQKRVVVQVTADGLSSDPWAWRKYGQKPIKGSIYPRSYYRCSSSKGCMARRQVEQSCTDPSIYILTYTADHNHAQPTRRNSLAGITRNRFKITPKSPTISDGCKTVTVSKDSPFHSPTTPSVSSIEDEILQQSNIKQETMFYNKFDDQEHTMMTGFNDDDFMIYRDDFFEDLEDLGGFKMDSSSYNCSNQQFPHVFS
ncbi:probable WRKY transcription factor 29 [Cynara cardunculus var. scolymus]|uniref:DNA-binding WRKY n=1 Tax=Cynara cardunculus var. scolymus TaxID=59895 RepID=A0A103XRD5_CYNCS|nr:probable WRKY transcription factor 29 [Cynara cardunculus var. scolymus]KVH95414.1 DNA-binding WRKY [Cynara cardunculus var. scolymus]